MSVAKGVPLEEGPPTGALTLPGFLTEKTSVYAAREALVFYENGGRISWTYGELQRQAEAVARALIASGVGNGTPVGILMSNRPEWVSMFFGIGLAGGVAVPLSTFSTPAELAYLIEASGISILAMESKVAKNDLLASLISVEPAIAGQGNSKLRVARFPFLRQVVVVGAIPSQMRIPTWKEFLKSGDDVEPDYQRARPPSLNPSDVGVIFFSSGSTSSPKGVVSAHRGVVLQFYRQATLLGLAPADDVRAWTPNGFFWSGNCAQVLGATLAVGGAVVLQSIFDADGAIDLMVRERVNYPQAWPHQWAQLETASSWLSADLRSLRFFDNSKIAGKQATIDTDWVEPRWCYGSTETFTISTGFPACSPADLASTSHGVALPGNTIKIVDPTSGEVLPLGEIGEIAVKGPTLMLGYLGIPAADTFDDTGFFRTGDSGYLDERGRLFWEGRLSDIIKTGGANVSPLEIDDVLAGHPEIKATKTIGVPHATLGEMVVACVLLHRQDGIDEQGLITFLKGQLSGYKVPRRILVLDDEEFAYTGSSKIKAATLRDLARAKLES